VLTPEDWEEMEENIQYDFLFDNHFSELRDAEILNTRLDILMKLDQFVGKYYSTEYIRKEVLKQSDIVYEEMDVQMATDIQKGLVPDPVHTNEMNAKVLEMSAQPPELPAAPEAKEAPRNKDSDK